MEIALDDVLPHRGPARLLDAVESFDAAGGELVARFTPAAGCRYDDGAGIPAWAAIEYMAQAAAALVGCKARLRDPQAKPRIGFLLGTRKLDLRAARFERGKLHRVRARCTLNDDFVGAFDCTVEDAAGGVLAACTLNACRPTSDEQMRELSK